MQTTHRCWVYGNDVNTDVIFPGKYTYTLKTSEDIAAHALEDFDPSFASNVRHGDIIVAGRNWGCGSSREQGVTALKYAGISMIIARSFAGIYYRNCINQGLLPIVLPELHDLVKTGDTVIYDHSKRSLLVSDQIFPLPQLSPSVQAIIDAGGLIPMLQRRFARRESA